jgi:hypothetical protein
VRKVLKPSGTLWVSGTQHVIFSIGYAMQELGFHLLNTVTWYIMATSGLCGALPSTCTPAGSRRAESCA